MSQIETLLLFVLGFSLATLIALFAGRMVWTAALKVGARRMQKQVPSSLVGLQTERDRLRAEYAMLSQRLSSKLDAVKLRMAEQMAEVTRHRNRVESLTQTLSARDSEIESLKARLAETAKELTVAATLQDEMRKALAARDAELADIRKELAERPAAVQQQPTAPAAAHADGAHDKPIFKTKAGGQLPAISAPPEW
jgi:chromosome segregation ATPase